MYPKYVIYIALRMYATRNVYNQKIEHIIIPKYKWSC